MAQEYYVFLAGIIDTLPQFSPLLFSDLQEQKIETGERSHKMRSPRWVAADYKAEMTLGNRQPSSSTVDLRNQGITLLANRHAAALPRSSSVPTSSDRASQSRMSLDGTCICIGERSSSTRTSRRMRSMATVQE